MNAATVSAAADDSETCRASQNKDAVEACSRDAKDSVSYKSRADAYWYKHDYDRALRDYNEALRLDPQPVDAYVGLGNAHAEKGEQGHALSDFNQALPAAAVIGFGRCRVEPNQRASGRNFPCWNRDNRGH